MKNRVKEIRKKAGLSQFQLSYLSGLSQSTISHIERGVFIPTIDSAYKIAAVLGVRVDEVFVPEACELPKPYNSKEVDRHGGQSSHNQADKSTAPIDGGGEAEDASSRDPAIRREMKK